jgi:hypothetical protein
MNTSQISVIPKRVDLVVYAGDGVELQLSSVNAKTGDNLDLAGELDAQVKANRSDTEPIVEFAINTEQAADGILELSLSGEQTAALITSAFVTIQRIVGCTMDCRRRTAAHAGARHPDL